MYVYMYACLYVCMYVCVYVCMSVSMYAWMYLSISNTLQPASSSSPLMKQYNQTILMSTIKRTLM